MLPRWFLNCLDLFVSYSLLFFSLYVASTFFIGILRALKTQNLTQKLLEEHRLKFQAFCSKHCLGDFSNSKEVFGGVKQPSIGF